MHCAEKPHRWKRHMKCHTLEGRRIEYREMKIMDSHTLFLTVVRVLYNDWKPWRQRLQLLGIQVCSRKLKLLYAVGEN